MKFCLNYVFFFISFISRNWRSDKTVHQESFFKSGKIATTAIKMLPTLYYWKANHIYLQW